MIRVDGISFSYGKNHVLDGLSFTVGDGECAVLAGPNGSGKTTALAVIAGIIKPSSGAVHIDGGVGYVPQGDALLPDATVGENLRFFASLAGAPVPGSLPFAVESYKKKRASRLSGGMKKQVSIACAMAGEPRALLLDEPCAPLDVGFREEMAALIALWKRERRAVVYVGHDPDEFFPFFDRIVLLGTPPRIYERADVPGDEAGFLSFYKSKQREIERK